MSAETNLHSSLCLDFQVTASYCSDVYDEQMANQTLKEGVADKVLAVIQGTVREPLVQTSCASVLYSLSLTLSPLHCESEQPLLSLQ